jgi:hypothetical protein
MKRRIEGRSGVMGSKMIIAIVALIVVVAAVAAVLVINGTSDNKDDQKLHTHMSAGGTITYEAVEGASPSSNWRSSGPTFTIMFWTYRR